MKRKFLRMGLIVCALAMLFSSQAFASQKPIGKIFLDHNIHNKIYISPNGEGKVWTMLKYGSVRNVYSINRGTYQVKYKGKIGYVLWEKALNLETIDVFNDNIHSGEKIYSEPSTKSKVVMVTKRDYKNIKSLAFRGKYHKVNIDGTVGWIPVDYIHNRPHCVFKPEMENVSYFGGAMLMTDKYLLSKIGPNYKSGAAGPNKFNSSGLVYHYWNYIRGIKNFPRSMDAQYKFLKTTVPKEYMDDELTSVAAVFFDSDNDGKPNYEGLYLGDGKVIAAVGKKTGIKLIDLNSPFYQKRFLCAKTFYRGIE